MENKLLETAFVVKENEQYKLRVGYQKMEIDLCGHATLATTYVITSFVEPNKTTISFHTRNGILKYTLHWRKIQLFFCRIKIMLYFCVINYVSKNITLWIFSRKQVKWLLAVDYVC